MAAQLRARRRPVLPAANSWTFCGTLCSLKIANSWSSCSQRLSYSVPWVEQAPLRNFAAAVKGPSEHFWEVMNPAESMRPHRAQGHAQGQLGMSAPLADAMVLLHRLWKTPGKAKGMGMLWGATQRCLTHRLPADSSAHIGDTALFCAGRQFCP